MVKLAKIAHAVHIEALILIDAADAVGFCFFGDTARALYQFRQHIVKAGAGNGCNRVQTAGDGMVQKRRSHSGRDLQLAAQIVHGGGGSIEIRADGIACHRHTLIG